MEILVHNHPIFLHVAGSGPQLVICLHGYGNTGGLFDFLGEQISEGVRIVALDLPGFGNSPLPWHQPPNKGSASIESRNGEITLKRGKPIPPKYWADLLQSIINAFPETENIILFGYSIGARIALHWFSNFDPSIPNPIISNQPPISKVILIAPDGLRIHPLYRFCVKNVVGRSLFRKTLRHPGPFLFILRMLYKLKLLDKARYRFVRGEIESKAKRELLEGVWLGYAGLEKNMPQIRERTQGWNTSWHLIWGEKDRVIKPKWGQKFADQVPGTVLSLLRGGHALLIMPSKKLKVMIDNLLKEK